MLNTLNMGFLIIVFYLALLVLIIAAHWRLNEKAGQPGWACIVPIYNVIVWLKIAQKPGWWLLLLLIPLVNLVIAFVVWIDIAKLFGKDSGFGIGLTLLGFIFLPILAFGPSEYLPLAEQAGASPNAY